MVTGSRPPARRSAAVALAAGVLLCVATPSAASARPAAATSPGNPTTSAPSPSTTSPAAHVAALQLDQANEQLVATVAAQVAGAQRDLDAAKTAEARAQADATAATAALTRDVERLAALTATERRQARAVTSATAHVKRLAVAAYESGGPGGPVAALLSSDSIGEFAHRQAYFTIAADDSAAALRRLVDARAATDRATRITVDAVAKARGVKQARDEVLARTHDGLHVAQRALADRQAVLLLARDAVSIPDTDIPRMVLDAYQRAATAARAAGCRLQWWGLAGIGRVESDHGRAEHAQLEPSGDLVPHIVGVPLTGQNGTALVVDSSGDYAQAEGPMQFIPSTWAKWGRDGNGDGVKSPDNIYDAALAAAAYLCATSAALDGDPGLQAAYLSYNHSADYVTEVLAYAHSYEAADLAGLIPSEPPVPLYQPASPGGAPSPPASTPGAT